MHTRVPGLGGAESEAGIPSRLLLSTEPSAGLDPTTLTPRPEPKWRVGRLTGGATLAPYIVFNGIERDELGCLQNPRTGTRGPWQQQLLRPSGSYF